MVRSCLEDSFTGASLGRVVVGVGVGDRGKRLSRCPTSAIDNILAS